MLCVQLTTTHDKDDPFADMTSATAYAIQATVHGTTKYAPSQLIYAKGMILRTNVEANIKLVRKPHESNHHQQYQ